MGERIDAVLLTTVGWVPARVALAVMAWFGFINLYMVRVNLSVIIVAMVRRNASVANMAPCLTLFNTSYEHAAPSEQNESWTQIPSAINEEEGEMDWNETIQGLVLASFFYGYATTQIAGGRVAELYGTRWVFGGCIFAGGICALLSPIAARTHYGVFITLRVIQGIMQGVSWPAMHSCISRWIPPLERPRFIAVVYFAAALSTSLTLPLCGVLIAANGWAAAFYVTGALSIVWCAFWFPFMHDTPRQHPRISVNELEYIEDALQKSGTSRSPLTELPVRSILRSLPLWSIIVVDFGNNWGLSLFLSQLPTYMKNILGFSIKENGGLSALPFLLRYVGAIVWSSFGDWLIKHGYLCVKSSRRIFSAIAMLVPAALLLAVSYSYCNWQVIVSLICIAHFCNGAVTASIIVNHTDIAPNFSGTIYGMANTGGSIAAFIVPVVVGAMTDGQQTLRQWQKVFWMFVPVYSITEIFYLLFCSGTVQPWNYPNKQDLQMDVTELDKLGVQ